LNLPLNNVGEGWKVGYDDDEISPTGTSQACNRTPYDALQYGNSSFTLTIPLEYSLVNGPPWNVINTATMQAKCPGAPL
jgi:hypothetical protein